METIQGINKVANGFTVNTQIEVTSGNGYGDFKDMTYVFINLEEVLIKIRELLN